MFVKIFFSKIISLIPEREEPRLSYKDKILLIDSCGYFSGGYGYMDYEKYYQAKKYIEDDPWIEEAFLSPKIGIVGIKAMKYNKQSIKRMLIKFSNTSYGKKIADLLVFNGLKIDKFYSNDSIRSKLEKVYKELSIEKKAAATQINDYFDVKPMQEREGDKRNKGYFFIRKKNL